MDTRTVLIAFVFAALAAGVFWLGWSGQERYEAARAERAALAAAPADEGGLTAEDRTGISLVLMGAAGAALFWLRLLAFQEGGGANPAILFGSGRSAALRRVLRSRQSLVPLLVIAAAAALVLFLA